MKVGANTGAPPLSRQQPSRVEYVIVTIKFMTELCVTSANIEKWLQRAKDSDIQIERLSLTADDRFMLEHRSDGENAGRLASFVCYDIYCEKAETACEVVDIIGENL